MTNGWRVQYANFCNFAHQQYLHEVYNPLTGYLKDQLAEVASNNALRSLNTISAPIDFTSNDYLGLSRSTELFDRIERKTRSLMPVKNGATGSRLLSGNSAYTLDVEKKLAEIFQSESSLIFNSGYMANLAVLSSLAKRGDTIILDELAHACMKDGARLSLAKRFSFKHNDLADLESKLKKAEGRKFIAVESVYSMDGDICPLNELTQLAEKYEAHIILDEAHSTGVTGKGGSGLAVMLGLEKKIAVRIYTFGKAMGIHGACVAGPESLTQFLTNFARPFIYTTALPPHDIAAIDCAFSFLSEHMELQEMLKNKIQLFAAHTNGLTNRTQSASAIQSFLFPGNDNVKNAARLLQEKSFDVRPILSPTVAEGKERLRLCLHAFNTDEEIIALAKALKKIQADQ